MSTSSAVSSVTGLPSAKGGSPQLGLQGPPAGPNTRSASRGGGRARIPVAPYVFAADSDFTAQNPTLVNTSSDSSNNMSTHSFGPIRTCNKQETRSKSPSVGNVINETATPVESAVSESVVVQRIQPGGNDDFASYEEKLSIADRVEPPPTTESAGMELELRNAVLALPKQMGSYTAGGSSS